LIIWGVQILTLHLIYVAGYTGPLLFLFERTHNYYVDNPLEIIIDLPFGFPINNIISLYVDNQGLVPWRLRRVGRSKVRSASLVKVLSDDKISSDPRSQLS